MASFNGPGWLEAMTWAGPLWPCFYLSASQSVLKIHRLVTATQRRLT